MKCITQPLAAAPYLRHNIRTQSLKQQGIDAEVVQIVERRRCETFPGGDDTSLSTANVS